MPRLPGTRRRAKPSANGQGTDPAWLVQDSEEPERRLRAQAFDENTWLVTRGAVRRRVRRLGPPELSTSLVYDPDAAERRPGAFERHISDFIAYQHITWLLRELEINVVLDVGANVGQYGRRLRRNGYKGRIVSFEPLPHLVTELRKSAKADPDWRVFDTALGDEDGTAEINTVPGAMSSMLTASEFGRNWSDRLRETHTETIQVRRLQDVLDESIDGIANPRIYLKLDTQGFDLQAFRGAGERIKEIYGLQSEVSFVPIYDGMPRITEQLATYEGAGFETTGLFQVSRHRPTMRVIEFDLVMIGPPALDEIKERKVSR